MLGLRNKNRKKIALARPNLNCQQLIYVYQGWMGELFMKPLKFAKYANIWKRNLVMFRDPDRSCYHSNNIDINAEIKWQRQYREDCKHVKELYCTGTSAGGYAAILFGHYLKADAVFALGAFTKLDLDRILDDPKMPNKSIDQSAIPAAHMDLRKLLNNWNGKTKSLPFNWPMFP